jgi:hypothetical protein
MAKSAAWDVRLWVETVTSGAFPQPEARVLAARRRAVPPAQAGLRLWVVRLDQEVSPQQVAPQWREVW